MEKSLEIVKKELRELGFFKYCKDEKEVIEDVFKDYKDDGRIHFSNKLNRLIAFDCYQIYELRGVLDFVEDELQPILKSRGQEIIIGECIENQDESDNYTERTIEINGKLHDIRGDNGWCWTRTFMATHKMIDSILSEFAKEEQIYSLYLGSINCFLIADEPLFEYLKNLIPIGEQMYPRDLYEYYEQNPAVFFDKPEELDSSDWKQVLPILYNNLQLLGGKLELTISKNYFENKSIDSIRIEFDTNDFEYLDPLYGRQNSNGGYNMFIEIECKYIDFMRVSSVRELESNEFFEQESRKFGSFSNSIAFTIPRIKFGTIKYGMIEFEMDFVLTNGESYSLMKDDVEEHSELSGNLKTNLKIDNLWLEVPKGETPVIFEEHLDDDFFDLKEAKLTVYSAQGCDVYHVPMKR